MDTHIIRVYYKVEGHVMRVYIFINRYLTDLLWGKGYAIVDHAIPIYIHMIDEVK